MSKIKSYLNRTYKLSVLFQSVSLMGKSKAVYLGFFGVSLATVILGVVISPIMTKRVINSIEFADRSLFYSAILLMILATLLSWLVAPATTYAAAWASKRAMFHVRSRFTEHLLRLPYPYHHTHSRGEALSLISNDLGCLESIYDHQLYRTLDNFCVGFTGLVMLFVIDWRLAIIASILGFGSTWIANCYSVPIGLIGLRIQENAGKTTIVFLDILKGIRTIKLFNLSDRMRQKLVKTTNGEADSHIRLANRQAFLNVSTGVMNGLSTFGIIIIGAFMVQKGLTDWGTVVVVSSLQNATGDLFSLFPASLATMQASLVGVERLQEVLNEPQERLVGDKLQFISSRSQEEVLEMRNVSFNYGGSEAILKNVNFTLKKGELTALIGESGAGKSTLFKLLLALYFPTEGQISIFNVQTQLNLRSWRENIAYVPQDPHLFRGTIAENIACGKIETDMSEIESAAIAAGIHEFIQALPEGYQTLLFDDGKNLSGGQRQRIAIARALVKQAPILLLDELTSSLDGENEARIMQSIRHVTKTRAVMLITHRESTLAYTDKVIRLDSGVLVPA